MKIHFIGAGNMASALIGGLIARDHPRDDLLAMDPSLQARQRLLERHQVAALPALESALPPETIVVLAVKPQLMRQVAHSLAPMLRGNLVISIAAGIRLAELARWLGGHRRLARVMPNTPALVGAGISALYMAPAASADDRDAARRILAAVGEVIELDAEDQLDAVTAISGSGPAYVFRWMEAMESAAAGLGLTAEQAHQLVLHTFRGASELARQAVDPPGVLREQVTSKGGTTAAALEVMNARDIGSIIGAAVQAAHARSVQLGDELGDDPAKPG